MKCAACNYQFWNSKYEDQEKFILIEGTFMQKIDENESIPVKLYACPKCGTVKMLKY